MEDSSVVLGSYEKHYFAQCAFAAQSEAKQEDIDQQFSAFQQQEADNARAWRLKSATTDCASAAPTRSLAWYSLAAENWQCANAITERYTDQKRAMYSDPWYYRQISSAADQAKFDTCLAHGLEYIEKSLTLELGNSKAVIYQWLLYREKQKTAKL